MQRRSESSRVLSAVNTLYKHYNISGSLLLVSPTGQLLTQVVNTQSLLPRAPAARPTPPVAPGADTEAILRDWGVDAAVVERLRGGA